MKLTLFDSAGRTLEIIEDVAVPECHEKAQENEMCVGYKIECLGENMGEWEWEWDEIKEEGFWVPRVKS